MKLRNYFQNPQILHVGTQPLHAYYVPCTNEKEAINADMMTTSRVKSLNGVDWKFKYFKSYHEVPEYQFSEQSEFENFDSILVPSCWQILGYDQKQYVNARYPIPFDPPYVPDDNPTGVYVKEFWLTQQEINQRIFLNFDGVDSCYYVWVNGMFIGYSQISHSGSEFEITDCVKVGKNLLSVVVLKWCDGTYLEDQDKLRFSGIFRDVYLVLRPKEFVRDFTVKTDLIENYSQGVLKIELELEGTIDVTLRLYDPEGICLGEQVYKGETLIFQVSEPQLWDAENPNLYSLIIETKDEVIAQKVGIRKVEVKGNLLLLNGKKFKLKGVNRHDSDPYTGAVISREQLEKDLSLMKAHNVNAIRTSHYPNAPWAMQMYDRYGFYVMDEADLEAHGCGALYGGIYEPNDMAEVQTDLTIGYLMQDKAYEKAVLDRIQHLVIRDKNCASVFSWSLGNESGYGPNLEKAAIWVKTYDDTRVISYENSIWQIPESSYINDTSNLDLFTRMYSSLEFVDAYCSQEGKKPFVEIEYCHAMGNGPGDLEEYFQKMYQYDGYAGGFVWEWCDHSIYMGKAENGKDKFYYGGDWKEPLHDENFCMDGLVYPNRTPHTGLKEFKNVARPVRACWKNRKEAVLFLENKMDFTNIEDRYDILYQIEVDGNVKDSGYLESVYCPPGDKTEVKLSQKLLLNGNVYLHLYYIQKIELPLLPVGYVAGHDQLVVNEDMETARGVVLRSLTEKTDYVMPDEQENMNIGENENQIFITGTKFCYIFDKWKGCFSSLTINGYSMLDKPIELNVWRAPMDNDRWMRSEWEKAGYDQAKIKVYSVNCRSVVNSVEIEVDFSMAAPYRQRIMSGKMVWSVKKNGTIHLKLEADRSQIEIPLTEKKLKPMPFLPRFGLRMFLPKEYDKVTYFGYGPQESYNDKHHDSWKGLFSSTAEALHEDYIKPQENGSHCGCLALGVTNSDKQGVLVSGQEFSFNVSCYTQEELTEKKHNFELQNSPYTVVCLDGYMSGCGSDSCGHRLLEKYQTNTQNLVLNFILEFL